MERCCARLPGGWASTEVTGLSPAGEGHGAGIGGVRGLHGEGAAASSGRCLALQRGRGRGLGFCSRWQDVPGGGALQVGVDVVIEPAGILQQSAVFFALGEGHRAAGTGRVDKGCELRVYREGLVAHQGKYLPPFLVQSRRHACGGAP